LAAVAGVGGAQAAPTPTMIVPPRFALGPAVRVGWSAVAFSPTPVGHAYLVTAEDGNGAGAPVTATVAAPTTNVVLTLSEGHTYAISVASIETTQVCVGGRCVPGPAVQSPPSPPVITTVDTSPPAGAITIDDGAPATNSASVVLGLSATDAPPGGASGVGSVAISDTGAFGACVLAVQSDPSCPIPFMASHAAIPHTLAGGPDGPRTVTVRYRDRARFSTGGLRVLLRGPQGNVSAPVSATILLDTRAPTVRLTESADSATTLTPVNFDASGSTDGASAAGDSGLAPDGYSWDFGDGARAVGPTTTHAYRTPGLHVGTLAVRDRAGNRGTMRFTVRVSAPRAVAISQAKPGRPRGVAAVLRSARLLGRRVHGRLRARLLVLGRAPRKGTLVLTLTHRRPGRARLAFRVPVVAGRFSLRMRLPARLLPGPYRLRAGGRGRALTLSVPGPPRGVPTRGIFSAVRGGPAATRLPAGLTTLFVRFRFVALPARRRPVTVVFIAPGGRVGPPVGKPRSSVVDALVKGSGALPVGRWRAILRVARVPVARASVVIRPGRRPRTAGARRRPGAR
jgi:PKD domain-containing protein